MTRNLSACVLEKFNGNEIIRNNLSREEKIDFVAIGMVYEPSFDKDKPVLCYFSPNIHLAYKSYIGKFEKGKEKVINRTVRQCHCCKHYLAKKQENMQKHLSICAAKEGITYSFNNSQIIDYQDNYKYIGVLPFTVYFDFETATGDAVFFDSKMFVISYCMIFSFNKELNFDEIVIFRSFQQSANILYDISHFKPEHVPFFDKVILRQLKDAASAVAFREKCTSLAEMLSVELKFTVDTLKAWFNKIIKPKFFDLDYNKKDDWRKKNPLTNDTVCTICEFPIDSYAENGWFDHVVNSEHLFLRNIYPPSQMKIMSIDDIDEYKEGLYRLLNIFTAFEDALQYGQPSEEVINFIRELDLCDTYDNLNNMREDIEKFLCRENLSQKNKNYFVTKCSLFYTQI